MSEEQARHLVHAICAAIAIIVGVFTVLLTLFGVIMIHNAGPILAVCTVTCVYCSANLPEVKDE